MPKKIFYFTMVVLVALGTVGTFEIQGAEAVSCPDLRIVFARGSGGERWKTEDYLTFKSAIEQKLATVDLDYEFIDLDYPAIGIGLDNLDVALGAFFGAGDAYEFGASINTGVKNLTAMVNGTSCPSTKYVLGGYSQGAMVISKSLRNLNAEQIIYAATFGDPKLYLPEGAGIMPAACRGDNLSDYRMYVPDCQAYKGLLGAYIPYEPSAFASKVGVWCNKRDIFCSSHFGIGDHLAYAANDLYEDAALVIFDKITKNFGLENHISSPHDTAILIDSTGSMSELIRQYKAEALRLTEKTLEAGGRVALYDYRDYQEGYMPRQWCNFENCTLEAVTIGLAGIEADGGKDAPESLLASSLHVMQELNWKHGSIKSIVILTDAGYHDPDFDIGGTTRLDVVRMSKQIDPVNFYVVTKPEVAESYADLTSETNGRVVTTADDLTELVEYIMKRYDSLPRVEESEADEVAETPALTVGEVALVGDETNIKFTTTGTKTVVILNDAVLGIIAGDTVTIGGLDLTTKNVVTLVPLDNGSRGEPTEVELGSESHSGGEHSASEGRLASGEASVLHSMIPKAPNTGRR